MKTNEGGNNMKLNKDYKKIIIIINIILFIILISNNTEGWIKFITTGIVSTILTCFSVLFLIMNHSERVTTINKVKSILWRH